MKKEIVKIQRPVVPTDNTVWVYTKESLLIYLDKSHPSIRKALRNNDLRQFWLAELPKDGDLVLVKRLKEQGW